VKNKKPEIDSLIECTNPDIIIGTETWLDPSISSAEYFNSNTYTVYRKDRPPNQKGQSHGGVLIAIKNDYQSIECKELQTNCENVWVELTLFNSRKLIIGSFYRLRPDDNTSLGHLNESFAVSTKILSQFYLLVVTSTLEILTGIRLAPFLENQT